MGPSPLYGVFFDLDVLAYAIPLLTWVLWTQFGANQEEPGSRGQTGPQGSFLQDEVSFIWNEKGRIGSEERYRRVSTRWSGRET